MGVPLPGPGVTTQINPKDGAEMVYVAAGEFLMGSKEGEGYSDERPQHTVYLDGYWIYKTEVTVAQYRKFCQATGRAMPSVPSWGWQDAHPIVNVTWDDAVAYATWAGASLPTEAEWEKAARGTDGRLYPWGNEWDRSKCSNSVSGPPDKTSPVGSFPEGASPYGALDMAGNVWEWCADWYDQGYYQSSPLRNPTGPATGSARALRGGSWGNHTPDYFCAANRVNYTPTYWCNHYGFRCALRSPGQ
jgi:formylglycine-generating enzyme required for sulfatase activity